MFRKEVSDIIPNDFNFEAKLYYAQNVNFAWKLKKSFSLNNKCLKTLFIDFSVCDTWTVVIRFFDGI
jgi:hypothetical protein